MFPFQGISLHLSYLTWFTFNNVVNNAKKSETQNRWIGRRLVVAGNGGHNDLCIIRLADCAFVLALRPVLVERWRAGGACLRPNACDQTFRPSNLFSWKCVLYDYGKNVSFFKMFIFDVFWHSKVFSEYFPLCLCIAHKSPHWTYKQFFLGCRVIMT